MFQIIMLTCALAAPKCDPWHYATRVEGQTFHSEDECLTAVEIGIRKAPTPEGFQGRILCVNEDGEEL